jgi:hypothetical protein
MESKEQKFFTGDKGTPGDDTRENRGEGDRPRLMNL